MELTPRLFVALWGFVLFAVVAWALRPRQLVALATAGEPMVSSRSRGADLVAGVAFGAFLVVYAGTILWREDFAYYDENLFTDVALAGRHIMPPIWPHSGRFFPLAHLEFNVLAQVSHTAAGFHVYPVLQLFALVGVLLYLLRQRPFGERLVTTALVLSGQSVVIAFTGLMFPERNVVVLMAILVAAVQEHDRRPRRVGLAIALAAGHFLLYYKEPIVVLIGAFVSTRLAIRFFVERPALSNVPRWVLRSPLEAGLVALSFVFAALFAFVMLPSRTMSYVNAAAVGPAHATAYYLRSDAFLVALIVAIAMRVAVLRRHAWRADPLWDAIMIGGVVYALAVIGVGLTSPYYLAPTDAIAALTLPRATIAWWRESRWTALKIAMASTAFVLALVTISQSAFRIVERKNMVQGTVAVTRFLNEYVASASARPVRLYFPRADGFALMRLASFLRYQGVAVNTVTDSSYRVEIGGPLEFPAGRCVPYTDYACSRLSSGDLTVFASDDHLPPRRVDDAASHGAVLFHYRPWAFPEPVRRVVARLFPLFAPNDGRPVSAQWLEWTIVDGHSASKRAALDSRGR